MDWTLSVGLFLVFFLMVASHGIAAVLVTLAIIAVVILLIVGFVALYKKANP